MFWKRLTQLLFSGLFCTVLAHRLQRDLISSDDLVLSFYSNQSCLADLQCTKESCTDGDHGNGTGSMMKVCGCEQFCLDLGSCCANYEAICIDGASPTHEANLYDSFLIDPELALSRIEQTIIDCTTIGHVDLYVAVRCKRPLAPGITDTDVALCEGLRMVMISQIVPVVTENAVYKNIHCLRCNGLQESDIHHTIPVEPECSNVYMRDHSLGEDFADMNNLMQAIERGQCELFYDFNSFMGFSACGEYLVDSCNELYADTLPDFDAVQRSCLSYDALLLGEVNNRTTVFKNYHCALCNGVTAGLQCLPKYWDGSTPFTKIYLPSFQILLDFSGEVTITLLLDRACNFETQVLNVITNECVTLPCPQGYILHNSSHCILEQGFFFLQNGNQERINWSPIEVCVYHRSTSPNIIYLSREELIRTIFYFMHMGEDIRLMDDNLTECADNHNSQQSIRVVVEFPETLITPVVIRFISTILMEELSLSSLFGVDWTRITVQIIGTEQFAGEIEDLIFVGNDTDGLRQFPSEGNIKLYLPRYGAYVDNAEARVSAELLRLGGSLWATTFTAKVRPAALFNCTPQSVASLDIPPCVKRVDLATMSFGQVNESGGQAGSSGGHTEVILTLVCSSLSIIALVSSLTLFSLFPSLLNLPTRILISLLSTLLLAHVIFLVGGLTLWPPVGCSILAAVQHYAWLSSFAWMNCLSFNLYLKFRMSCAPSDPITMFAKYSVYGCGFPGLIVAICAVLHFLGLFQYGTPGSCWISGGLQLGFSFGLPVCSMICTNAVLFALIIRSLNQTMGDAGLANDAYTARYKLRIHIKIFSVMGSTWLLGFLSNVDQLAFLSYPFIVLSGSNGFVISLCFMLNQRFITTFKAKLTIDSTSSTAAAR